MSREIEEAVDKLEAIAKKSSLSENWFVNRRNSSVEGAKGDITDIKERLATMSSADAIFMNYVADRFNELSEKLDKVQAELSELKAAQDLKHKKQKNSRKLS